jgi:hypothetical protein
MSQTIKEQIIEQVDRLDDSRQQQVLDFARRLTAPAGTPGRNLLQFAGSIDPADLEAMSQAIQEDCEQVDPNAW